MNVNLTKEEIRLISKSLLNQKLGKRESIVAMDIFEKIETIYKNKSEKLDKILTYMQCLV